MRVVRPEGGRVEVFDMVTRTQGTGSNIIEIEVTSAQALARRYWFGSGWGLIRAGLAQMWRGVRGR